MEDGEEGLGRSLLGKGLKQASRSFLLTSLKRTYFVLSALLLGFAALNIIIGATFWLRDRSMPAVLRKYGIEQLRHAYPGWKKEDLKILLAEHDRASRLVFEPFTVFASQPLNGKFVHIQDGYRRSSNQPPWPPDSHQISTFVFGGSTTFGFGLSDDETIPTYLQRDLQSSGNMDVSVYNFGRIGYTSSQELALFTQLIRNEKIPRLAVFIDGMNEFSSEAWNALGRDPDRMWSQPQALPIIRILQFKKGSTELNRLPDADIVAAQRIDRWLKNKTMIESIAEKFGTRVLFVWQPVPVYKYDLTYDIFKKAFAEQSLEDKEEVEAMRKGYALLAGKKQENGGDRNLLWLADIQEYKNSNLYVDMWHYDARFSSEIAKRVCEHLLAHHYVD